MAQKLDDTTETILMFFPFFFKNLLKHKDKAETTPIMSPKSRALMILTKCGALSISEVGKKLYISKPNMTSLVDSLIEEGFVTRIDDKNDRRIIHIKITENGKKEAKELFNNAKEIIKGNLAQLDEKDLEDLHESIIKIKNIFSKLKGNDENAAKKCWNSNRGKNNPSKHS